MVRELFNLFDHKYPIENLHELDLSWVIKDVQQMEAILAEWEQVINELKEDIAKFDELEDDIAEIRSEIADLPDLRNAVRVNEENIADLSNKLETLNLKLLAIDSKFNAVYRYVDEKDYLLMLKINQVKVQLQAEIDLINDIISKIDTSVYNSWIDRKISNQENSDFAFNHLADECLTAEEYLSLGLSAADYAAFSINSRDYQEFGKKKLHFYWVYAPVYGFKQEISNVLTSIVNFLSNTLTASDYASLDLSAADYAALDLSAAQYFSYNPNASVGYVTVDPNNIGLTSEQFAHLGI